MKKCVLPSFAALSTVLWLGVSSVAVSAQTTDILLVSDTAAPDLNGSFAGFEPPILNDKGQVVFLGRLAGTQNGLNDDSGIFVADRSNSVSQVLREGGSAPIPNAVIRDFRLTGFNASGQVLMQVKLGGGDGVDSDFLLYVGSSSSALQQLVREGQSAPDGNVTLSTFQVPAFNNAGQFAFAGEFATTDNPAMFDQYGVIVGRHGEALFQIARGGTTSPDGNGVFGTFDAPSLNAAGHVAFNTHPV